MTRPRVVRPWRTWLNRILGERIAALSYLEQEAPGVEEDIRLVAIIDDTRLLEPPARQPVEFVLFDVAAVIAEYGIAVYSPARGVYVTFLTNEGADPATVVPMLTTALPAITASGTTTRRNIGETVQGMFRLGTTVTEVRGARVAGNYSAPFHPAPLWIPAGYSLVIQQTQLDAVLRVSLWLREPAPLEG